MVTDPGTVPDAAQLRRLTRLEFVASLRDVLGVTSEAVLEPDLRIGGMAQVGARKVSTSVVGVERYTFAVEDALDRVWGDQTALDAISGCDASMDEATCADTFVRSVGQRAWRRPLSEAEVTRTRALYDTCATNGHAQGLRCVASALLQSPYFLYRVELAQNGVYTGYAMASRLSYFLHGAPPDSRLLQAAFDGKLDTADGVREQAQIMLEEPRAVQGVRAFVDEWFRLDRLDDRLPRDFLAYSPEELQFELGRTGTLQPYLEWVTFAAKEELRRMVVDNVLVKEGDYLELLTTPETFVDPHLQAFYSEENEITRAGQPDALGFAPAVHGEDSPRRGVMSTMAFLSQQGKQNETSPSRRGLYVMEKILCQEVAEPPDDIDRCERVDGVSRRDSIEQHHLCVASCQGCHVQMDPIGFAMDGFNTIGQWRYEDDWGYDLDTQVDWTISERGRTDTYSFDSTRTMAETFRTLDTTSMCVVKQMLRLSTGQVDPDEATINALNDAFQGGDRSLKRFIVHLVGTDTFRVMPSAPTAPAGPPTTQRVHDEVFVTDCAPCHVGGVALGGLDLSMRDELMATLMLPSMQVSTMPLITSGDPENSYLWHKVNGTHADVGGSGDPMPPAGHSLSQEHLELVRAWIMEASR